MRPDFDGRFLPPDAYYRQLLEHPVPILPRIRSEMINFVPMIHMEFPEYPSRTLIIAFPGIGQRIDEEKTYKTVINIGSMAELAHLHHQQVLLVDPPKQREPLSFLSSTYQTIQALETFLTYPRNQRPIDAIRLLGYSQGVHTLAGIYHHAAPSSRLRKYTAGIDAIHPAAVSSRGMDHLKTVLGISKLASESFPIGDFSYAPTHFDELATMSLPQVFAQAAQEGVTIHLYPEYPGKHALLLEEDFGQLRALAKEYPHAIFLDEPGEKRYHIPGHTEGSLTLLRALGITLYEQSFATAQSSKNVE